jgi:hypothetical protein
MISTPTPPKVLCPECRRENESQRVYCHECGTRLDRSTVHFAEEQIQDTQKRVQRIFQPKWARLRASFFNLIQLIVAAGLVAGLVEIFLPPDVPPPSKNPVLASSLRFDLEKMATQHQPPQKQVDEQTVNAFIASVARSRRVALDHPLLPFKRALVAFHEQRCSVTAERALLGYYSIYVTCDLALELKDGRLSATIESGHIGRLPIHPKIAKSMGVLFGDVASVFDPTLKLVSKLGAIELHDKNLTLTATTP